MVTTKKPKKVVRAKKEVEPLVFYHDAFDVLKKLGTYGWRGDSALWHYAGAIRGPDSENECAKDISTAVIRGTCDYGNDIHMTRCRTFPSNASFDTMFGPSSPTGHFARHASKGLVGLSYFYKKTGRTREARVIESMADALIYREYVRYKKYLKVVIDNWDWSRQRVK
jgi:hypothetical protein